MASAKNLTVQQVIPSFRSASTIMAAYLIEGAHLSDTELDTVTNMLFGLQTSLQVWKKKKGMPTALRTNKSHRRVINTSNSRPPVSRASRMSSHPILK
jgi:hypothetical protein